MINDYDKGGLKMVDIKSFSQALKLKWIGKFLDNDNQSKWKLFFTYYLQEYGGTLIFQCNLRCNDVPLLKLRNTFLEEILQIWTQINFASEEQDFYNACIWYNSMVRINKRPFFYQSWFNAGIKYAKDLMDSNSNFLKYNAFLSKYGD